MSVSRVRPRWCREFSTATMWLCWRWECDGVGWSRGHPGFARRSARFCRRARVRRPTSVSLSLRRMNPASPIWMESHSDSSGTKCVLPARHGRMKWILAAFAPIPSFCLSVFMMRWSHSCIVDREKSAIRKWKLARPPARRFAATTLWV